MANPTTYFGWVMPNSADLVTDLPADFNVFGQGVDTSMQFLLGGTTGQVLSKTSATNMAFTWVTPTDETPLTTKGDLFSFTTVDARLAVGANETRLVADSVQATGLKYVADTTNYVIAAKADLLVGTAADTLAALTVGTNGQVLTADSTVSPTGLKWATPVSTPTFVGVGLVISGTSTSITQNTQLTFAFPAEEYDTNTFHDNSTNNARITIPTGYGGKYLITSQVMSPDNWNGDGYVYLYKNGSALTTSGLYNDGRFGSLVVTDGVNALIGSTVIALAAADYLELRFQSAITTGNHQMYVRWTATWLGA